MQADDAVLDAMSRGVRTRNLVKRLTRHPSRSDNGDSVASSSASRTDLARWHRVIETLTGMLDALELEGRADGGRRQGPTDPHPGWAPPPGGQALAPGPQPHQNPHMRTRQNV